MKKKFAETSAVERERKLWKASQEYINGKIDSEELEKIEISYEDVFKKATLTSPKTRSLENFSSIIIFFSFVMLIISSFFIYLYTQNQLLLILPSILSYPLFKLVKLFFSWREDLENGG